MAELGPGTQWPFSANPSTLCWQNTNPCLDDVVQNETSHL